MIEVTAENFKQEVLSVDKIVIVDFNADWCGPCQMQAPLLEEAAEELGDVCKFVSANIDFAKDLAIEYEVGTIPCLVMFKNGEEIDRKIGLQATKKVIKWVTKKCTTL